MVTKLDNDMSDSELIMYFNENDELAKDLLFERYSYIIEIILNKYKNIYRKLLIDEQELYSEATVGFSDALINFQDNKNASLPTFITLCVERRLYKIVKKYQTEKHKMTVSSYSLDDTFNYDRPLIELLSDESKNDPLKNLSEEESFKELVENIKNDLSESEYEVFTLMLNGYDYKEIANILKKSSKQIDNTMQRIRNKIKLILNDN